jgi:SAM-dependent methyltransferase
MDNYEYCAQWAMREAGEAGRVLDYGCGCGQVVAMLRARGMDAHGCDVFFDGGDFSSLLPEAKPYIRRMDSDRIPFEDATFDVVISNQVIEHVPDLSVVAAEIARVLRPSGRSLHIFPDKGVWVEAHTHVPFLHWLPKNTLRLCYAAVAKALQGKRFAGGRYACNWIDQWTHYRWAKELHTTLAQYFRIEHAETQWFDARFGRSLPTIIKRWITRRGAGMVLVLHPKTTLDPQLPAA